MSDSPTRRSSIPILKQTNKTKSFQSYVSLNFSDDGSTPRKACSPSSLSPPIVENSRMPPKLEMVSSAAPKLEINSEIVITKLCEENKRLKEHQIQLVSKFEEALRENMEIQNRNDELRKELSEARRENNEKIFLQKTVENLQKQQLDVVDQNKKLQKKLGEIFPENIKDFEANSNEDSKDNDLGNILGELEKLKSYLNNVELQLYEANEHISDLMEKNAHFEAENLVLKTENLELNNLSKLMQANMHETLDTSRRMEETFLRMKLERDELIKTSNRDDTDGDIDSVNVADEIADHASRQKKAYEPQFIEYNAELDSLKIQVKLLETELEISRMRAESSEEECRQLKATIRNSAKLAAVEQLSAPVPPPPPPPPPNFTKTNSSLSNIPQTFNDAITDAQQKLHQTDESKLSRKATGLEAVIDDLKNGRVTLRRRRVQQKVPISPKENYTNIYELLEKNQQQNRSSRKILDTELTKVFKKFNVNF